MRAQVAVLLVVFAFIGILCVVVFGVDSAPRSYSGRQWEYRILDLRDVVVNYEMTPAGVEQMNKVGIVAGQNIEHVLDQFGAQGWELVTYADEMAVFKRPH